MNRNSRSNQGHEAVRDPWSSAFGAFLAGALVMACVLWPVAAEAGTTPQEIDDPGAVLARLLDDPRWTGGLDQIHDGRDAAAELLVEIGGIVSPSGREHERAARVADELRAMGIQDVQVTGAPNVVARIPGRSGRAVVFISTLDDLQTVALNQEAASGPPVIRGDRVEGPGTNTSTVTVAMLTAARALVDAGFEPEHDLYLVGVAEEETGLRGMFEIVDQLGDKAVAYVDILGDGSSISYGALSIHWWRIMGEGPPGHSLGGGLPNVNQGLARAVDRILDWSRPYQDPANRTTVNVSILRSGEVFNHKPSEGWFSLDLRSLEAETVAEMEEGVRSILGQVEAETGIPLRMEPESLVPGGQIPGALESPLVRSSRTVAQHLGLEPNLNPAGSSNMNVAVARGIPAIGLGGSRGGERGHPGEWADIPAMMRTAEHVYLLALLLAGGELPVGLPEGQGAGGL
ncbi:MAG: M20/M25/M40 family metallo-hydrolase [Gemmatimonadales bacterium]|nr:MAG: M20/M25/M40 family metallo-hydrolase [Gemmatimonadales bacterium]